LGYFGLSWASKLTGTRYFGLSWASKLTGTRSSERVRARAFVNIVDQKI
jgi:hypothetical protein